MTKKDAFNYLAATVADYVANGFPITPLTGEQSGGKPDEYHLEQLQVALSKCGWPHIAAMVKKETSKI